MPAAFTVQTDDGATEDANAYIAVAFYDQYHTDRGRAAPVALTNDQKQLGIVRATDYVDARWRSQFLGYKNDDFSEVDPAPDDDFVQSTEWPRLSAYYKDSGVEIEGLPIELKKAIAEYAFRAATAELLVDPLPAIDSSGNPVPTGQVLEVEQAVGRGAVIEKKKFAETYQSLGDGTLLVDGILIKKIPAADILIEALLARAGRQRRAIR
jgi:hypothetical protein